MKKVFTTILAVIISSSLYAVSIRDSVCVVSGNLSQKNVKYLKDLSDSFETRGYQRYSEYIDSYLAGTFGSGFIYYLEGKPYIFTNRHVVQSAETASITFQNEDESVSEYKNLEILYSDEDVDFAIIQVPASFNRAGLSMYNGKLKDGDDVWSAGFPGLGNEPSWQLGKGIVSNGRAKIKQLIDPSISTIIQHTAEIDGGNSGGPLLIKNPSEVSGYSVAGVNTWKALYRENTNFAIPIDVIVRTAEKGIYNDSSESFSLRIENFKKDLKCEESDFDVISKFISDEMVEEYGEDAFIEAISTASVDSRSAIVNSFISNPIEGLRIAEAYTVWDYFNSFGNVSNLAVEQQEASENSKKIVFKNSEKSDEKSVSSLWIKEKGKWKLQQVDFITSKSTKASKSSKKSGKNGKKSVSLEYPYIFSVNCGVLYPFNKTVGYDLSGSYNTNFFSLGLFCSEAVIKDADVKDSYGDISKADYAEQSVGVLAGFHVPLQFTKFVCVPFINLRIGFSNFQDSNNFGYNCGVEGGCEGIFLINDDFGAGLGADYQYCWYPNGIASSVSVYLKLNFYENYY